VAEGEIADGRMVGSDGEVRAGEGIPGWLAERYCGIGRAIAAVVSRVIRMPTQNVRASAEEDVMESIGENPHVVERGMQCFVRRMESGFRTIHEGLSRPWIPPAEAFTHLSPTLRFPPGELTYLENLGNAL
jgi:hypothetical protein